jgi:pseudaminic acid cytidylyltransferase
MDIAIIPARGNSKRIPRKNVKFFHGKPIIAYAIENAIRSRLFAEIYVSTDDLDIAQIAIQFGAKVPWLRSARLSDDYATTVEVIQEEIVKLTQSKADIEDVCCIYPTTPFLDAQTLHQGADILKDGHWDYVISATLAESPPERFFCLDQDNRIQVKFSGFETTRSQDIKASYRDAGQFYWGPVNSWKSGLPLFSSRSTFVEIPRALGVDIDTDQDWQYAEKLFSIYGKVEE